MKYVRMGVHFTKLGKKQITRFNERGIDSKIR